jgi:hypothetical protein
MLLILGLSFLGVIIYFVINHINHINYMKKICIPVEDSDRIIISNLECISIMFQLLHKNKELESIIIPIFMKIFEPTIQPTKENFDRYITKVMKSIGYNNSSYYNINQVFIQSYLKVNYKTITDNCSLYISLGKQRYSIDFIKELTNAMKGKQINDTVDKFLLDDLLNIYLYYELRNCTLNKNIFNTTTNEKVLFENSIIYRMFTCFNDL